MTRAASTEYLLKPIALSPIRDERKSSQWFSRSSFVPGGTRSPPPSGPSVETLGYFQLSGTKQRPLIADKCDNGPGLPPSSVPSARRCLRRRAQPLNNAPASVEGIDAL